MTHFRMPKVNPVMPLFLLLHLFFPHPHAKQHEVYTAPNTSKCILWEFQEIHDDKRQVSSAHCGNTRVPRNEPRVQRLVMNVPHDIADDPAGIRNVCVIGK